MKKLFNISLIIFLSTLFSYNCFKESTLSLKEQYEVEELAEVILESSGLSIVKNIFSNIFNRKKKISCSGCKFGIDILQQFLLKKKGVEKFYSLMKSLCSVAKLQSEVCEGAISHYGDIVIESLIRKFADSNYLCALMKSCNDTTEYESIENFAQKTLLNKKEKKNKINYSKTENTKNYYKVVQVTDIHLDMEYKEGSIANCNYPLCCREIKTENLTNYELAGFYGHIGKCDANINTVKAFAQKVKELNPDYIMFTGDNIAHSVWNVQQSEVIKATKMIIDEIQNIIGKNIPIFPAIGNHEKAPVDEFHGDETELLDGLSDIFKPYLDDEAYLSFKKYGYYSILYKNTKLRIISLNCLLCDSFNFNLLYDSSQVRSMYKWLENELEKAEKNGEIVHIMDHIPMNNQQHSTECQGRLKILMDKYQNIIKGYFSGHTHNEFLSIIHEYNNEKKPTIINYINSGLTPYSQYNPSFRMYLVDKNDYYVQDYLQYRMDLKKSNELKTPIWLNIYNATKLFNVNSMDDIENVSKFEINSEYVKHSFTDVPGSEERSKTPEAIKNAKCRFENDNIKNLLNCTGYSIFSESYLFYAMNKLFKKWLK